VVVLVILLVAADFITKAVVENVAASQIQKQGFPRKPSVTVEGFPFLTQVAARDLRQVRLSSSDVPAGPVDLTEVNAVANGVHLNSNFRSGTIDSVSGTVLISFSSLASALTNQLGPAGAVVRSAGLTLSDAGPEEIKASVNLIVASGSATWRVTHPTPQQLSVTLVSSSGIPAAELQSIRNLSFSIPRLPLGVTIQTVSVTPSGIVGQLGATNLPFNQ
jgi:hypothetical protein